MRLESEETQALSKAIKGTAEVLAFLNRELKKEKQKLVDQKIAEGWKKFVFFSDYYGNHSEYGEGDKEETYLFAPHVDFSMWEKVKFGHGHHDDNEENTAFFDWLENQYSGDYTEI